MVEKLNTDMIVAGGLIVGLWAAIFCGMNELAMSIASGLVGYMGRALMEKKEAEEKKEDKQHGTNS